MTSPQERYAAAIAAESTALAALDRRWNRLANLRLVTAVGAVGFGIVWQQMRAGWAAAFALLLLAAFVISVALHRRVGGRRALARIRLTIAREGQARLRRAWNDLPQRPGAAPEDHPYAGDIDLYGHASLIQLVDATETAAGAETLRAWLLAGPDDAETHARQEAARSLVAHPAWRTELAVTGRRYARQAAAPAPLLTWLADATPPSGVVRIVATISAIGAAGGAVADALGLVDPPIWLPFVLVNGLLVFGRPGGTERLNVIAHHRRALSHYRRVLPVAERVPGQGARLDGLRARFRADGESASDALEALDRRLSFVIPPGTIVWPLLQLLLAWDVHVGSAVRSWAVRDGRRVPDWIAAVGELEALSSLAGLAADHPEWAWPVVDPQADRFVAEGLGHPLLPNEARVGNDVTVGPAGTVLLVTGSNMAGKSTLLRAIALNAVLARAGGPVCGASLKLAPWDVWTSVRIRDSLEAGVSLYMAELLRLRQIVAAARARPILYLLDEVLQGTNTAERRIAAQRILALLLETGSIGAVSTHDLELLACSPVAAAAVNVHVRDQVIDGPSGPEMTFDYILRPGISPTTNALRLLALVGLGDSHTNVGTGPVSPLDEDPRRWT